MSVRVRFAPSPTGPLHIGGFRTALYNYLFAKKHNGSFILRIEDTDQNRWVEGAENYILESLEWGGISPDESPKNNEKFTPYRQSERLHIYQEYMNILLNNGSAYFAFDTAEELDSLREQLTAEGKSFSYNSAMRKQLKNSFTLGKEKTEELVKNGVPYVIRFSIPDREFIAVEDIIRGKFSVPSSDLDDKILMKHDGFPTYHFANIVDDYLMQITHVIRGEEWLPSLPLHVLLYEAMGWKPPVFAHLPLILKPEGKGKLSKRDGDALGFPVFPLQWKDRNSSEISKGFREDGYFPDALLNTLALLGWTPSDEKEILSLEEMIQDFDLEKVHKSGARFNPEKAKWINQQYLQKKSSEEILPEFLSQISKLGVSPTGKETQIISLMKERVHFISELVAQSMFFYQSPKEYDAKSMKKFIQQETKIYLTELFGIFENLNDFSESSIKECMQAFATEKSIGIGKIMPPIRLLLVGEMRGPDVPMIMEILGKNETLNRLEKVLTFD